MVSSLMNFFFGNLVDKIFSFRKIYTYNPWFKLYKTNFEKQENKSTNVCILSIEIVKSIIVNHYMDHKIDNNEDENASIVWCLSILINF
jgi:hypothetical protein